MRQFESRCGIKKVIPLLLLVAMFTACDSTNQNQAAQKAEKTFKAEDTLILKNGGMIQGIIVRETPEMVTLQIDGGDVGFPRTDISTIRRGETLVKDDSGIAANVELPEEDLPYPRIYLKNGNIVYGSDIIKEEDTFLIKQELDVGGTISYGFKFDEIEKILLWAPPSHENLDAVFKIFSGLNLKYSYEKGPYSILSTVEASDSVLYFNTLQRVYEDFQFHFFDFLDVHKPHDAFPVILYGSYDQFLEFGGFPKGTSIQGYYIPQKRTLHLFNVKEVDMIRFQLAGAEYAGQKLGNVLSQIENAQAGARSGKWAAYDYIEKVSHEVERRQARLESIARTITIQTIRHEATHQMTHAFGLDIPETYRGAWFSEGIAQYMEPEEMGVVNVNRLMALRFELDGGAQLMPLQYLLSFKSGVDIHHLATNYTLMAYAQSWAFFYFLMENHKPELWAYMMDLKNQEPDFNSDQDIALLEKHLGKKISQIDAEFESFVKKAVKEKLDPEQYDHYRLFQRKA